MDEIEEIRENFVHLARIALTRRPQDVQAFLRRVARRSNDQELNAKVTNLLRKAPTPASPLRGVTDAMTPVDMDTRHHLVQVEERPYVASEPFYEDSVRQTIVRLVAERQQLDVLLQSDLEPTRTVLLTGPPGVGKTLTAKWIAHQLEVPMLILDLSSVMSSYLGRTGSNIRRVLDHAKTFRCVLLLDELDSVAKRRDDTEEIGELKRLVTVLIQQIDDWPSDNLLIAATNHSSLLDPAIWRRFEELVVFDLPSQVSVRNFLHTLLCSYIEDSDSWSDALSIVFSGYSFGEIEHKILGARRAAVIHGTGIETQLASFLGRCAALSKRQQTDLASCLISCGLYSKKQANDLVGITQNTGRKRQLCSAK